MIYKRENFVEESAEDSKFPVKTVEVLTPLDGGQKRFVGQVTMGLQTPYGVQSLPVNFDIEAETIEGAFAKFEARAEEEIEKAKGELQNQLQELRRQSQGRIVTPDQIAPGGMSKLQL